MEKRKSGRTSLISDFNTQFMVAGEAFADVHVSNIGPRGCCLQLPVGSARYLKNKPVLEHMILLRADAKKYSLKGKIAWYDEGVAATGPWIAAGIEFMDVPSDCVKDITDYVLARK